LAEYGTHSATDPREEFVAVLMIQGVIAQRETTVCQEYWNAVYQAISDYPMVVRLIN
jgi:hypothetical protein